MPRHRASRRRGRGYHKRRVKVQEPRHRFLIVCEGERTEPNYFSNFRVPRIVIDVRGFGLSPLKLVRTAENERRKDDYDQVWCVFDRDCCSAADFNTAIAKARRTDIRVAYSNEAFELWYLLHFDYYDTAIPRKEYIDKLNSYLGYAYQKNSGSMYEELLDHQSNAIRNAQRLLAQYSTTNPAANNPSTTVHELVEQLNKFAR